MLQYDDASVGARDRETTDGPAGSGAVRGQRVRELHVASEDFKGTSVRAVPWEGAARDGVRHGRRGGAALARVVRRARRRGAERGWLEIVSQCPCLNAKISKNLNRSAQSGE
jgi:hypothetical protein